MNESKHFIIFSKSPFYGDIKKQEADIPYPYYNASYKSYFVIGIPL